jgi:hypothetical protein
VSHNAALSVALDKLRRRCPECGHQHYATRCHVCKTLDPSYLGVGAADQPPPSMRLDRRRRGCFWLAIAGAVALGGLLALAAALLQQILERVAG